MAKIKGYTVRKSYGWIPVKHFPDFDTEKFPSRKGIGMNLDDFNSKNDPIYKFTIDGKFFVISNEKAHETAVRTNFIESLPHTIPIEAWQEIKDPEQEILL